VGYVAFDEIVDDGVKEGTDLRGLAIPLTVIGIEAFNHLSGQASEIDLLYHVVDRRHIVAAADVRDHLAEFRIILLYELLYVVCVEH
jgi:hypothetical protein